MPKWIEEENGDVWIPTTTVAKMLRLQLRTVGDAVKGVLLQVRVPIGGRSKYYLLSEVELLARDPKRLNWQIARETQQACRKQGDPAKVDLTFMTALQVQEFLGIKLCMMNWYVNRGYLTSYQRLPGRSRHHFDPYEVRVLRNRRERLERIRETNHTAHVNDARLSLKFFVPRKWKTGAMHESDLLPRERSMGIWISKRQAAALLEVALATVVGLRTRGRLYGEMQVRSDSLRKQKQWFYRKADVIALQGDADYRKGRETYRVHLTPLARLQRAEKGAVHTPTRDLDWEAFGSQWRVREGGDW